MAAPNGGFGNADSLITVLAIAAILLTWLVAGFTTLGIGYLVRRILLARVSTELLTTLWVGYAAVVAVCQLAHFVFPINTWVTISLVMLGTVGLYLSRAELGADLPCRIRDVPLPACGVGWVAFWCTGPCVNYDSLMYHIQGVRWAHSFAIVPGLANLQHNHGFNNANLLVSALYEVGPWEGRGFHVASGWLVAVMIARSLLGLTRILSPRGVHSSADGYYALLLPLFANFVPRLEVTSHSTDLVVTLLTSVIGGQLIASLTEHDVTGKPRAAQFHVLTLLGGAALCVKLSSFGFVTVAWSLGWIHYWSSSVQDLSNKLRTTLVACCLGAMLVVPWVARSILLSGYVGYPASVLRIESEWTLPQTKCDEVRDWVRDYGRGLTTETRQHPEKHTWSFWFPTWLSQLAIAERDRVLAPAVIGLLWLVFSVQDGWRHGKPRRLWLVLLPVIGGCGFWFWGAPSPRFGHQYFSIAFAVIGTAAMSLDSWRSRLSWPRIGLLLLVLTPQLYVTQLAVNHVIMRSLSGVWPPSQMLIQGIFLGLPPSGGLWQTQPSNCQPQQTRHNVNVWIPVTGTATWDAPLPASHYFVDDLRLLDEGRLQGGFASGGDE